jgi:hypothetical protein
MVSVDLESETLAGSTAIFPLRRGNRERDMRTVEIDLRSSELSGAMAEMRMWLDERRFEPSSFCYREAMTSVLVRVDFKVSEEAEAFATRFSGRIDKASADSGRRDSSRAIVSARSIEDLVVI